MADPHLKVKQLLANYMNSFSKINTWAENKIEIINMEICDAIIYNLRTIIKTNQSSEECFNLNVQPYQNSYTANSFNKTYPSEAHTYDLSTMQLKECFKCNGTKYIVNENEIHNLENGCDMYSPSLINCETGEIQHSNRVSNQNSRPALILCNVCGGNGKLNVFKRNTLVEDCIYDVRVKCGHKAVPLKCILKNKGNLVVSQTQKRLSAINNFPDDEIYEISNDLLKRHDARLKNKPGWELVNQSHQLIVIPISSYIAKYKEKIVHFYFFNDTKDIYINKKNKACSLL